MLYQLYIVDCKAETLVDVANSEEEFRNTTVEELKRIVLKYDYLRETYQNIDNFRLVYINRQLEDCDTLGKHGITHRDTILVVLRLLGGGGPIPPDERFPRTESMERLYLKM